MCHAESFINLFLFLLDWLSKADICISLKATYDSSRMKQALKTLVVRGIGKYEVVFYIFIFFKSKNIIMAKYLRAETLTNKCSFIILCEIINTQFGRLVWTSRLIFKWTHGSFLIFCKSSAGFENEKYLKSWFSLSEFHEVVCAMTSWATGEEKWNQILALCSQSRLSLWALTWAQQLFSATSLVIWTVENWKGRERCRWTEFLRIYLFGVSF